MIDSKKIAEGEEGSKETDIAVTRKGSAIIKPAKKTPVVASADSSDLWQAFDDTFEKFRSDFEDLLFPANWASTLSFVPENRVPVIDLEDRGKDFLLKAEMPGFKKEDIEIEVQEDAIAITGNAGWKYDNQGQLYICKERACKTFYRQVKLPEEIKVDEVDANLSQGVLEITLPKKTPKQKRTVAVK